MKNLFDALPILNRIKKQKQEKLKSKANIEGLYWRFYSYDPKIKIAVPNLYADNEIRRRFGEDPDYSKDEVLVEIIYILENQDEDILHNQSEYERKEAVIKRMQSVTVAEREKYQKALFEMYVALKKNSVQQQMQVLEQARSILDSPLDRQR